MKSKPLTCRFRRNSKRHWMRKACAPLAVALALAVHPVGVSAQAVGQTNGFALPEIPVLTIEPDRLFAGTQFGQRLAKEIETLGTQLLSENRSIEKTLADEESELTGLRDTLSAEEFRALADDFDARVTRARSIQDEKARSLTALSEQAQRSFLNAIAPVLEEMMNENGASVILDRRAVFLSADASDITSGAIERIDAGLGEGPGLDELLPVPDAQNGIDDN